MKELIFGIVLIMVLSVALYVILFDRDPIRTTWAFGIVGSILYIVSRLKGEPR
jgi:hypothetical protein